MKAVSSNACSAAFSHRVTKLAPRELHQGQAQASAQKRSGKPPEERSATWQRPTSWRSAQCKQPTGRRAADAQWRSSGQQRGNQRNIRTGRLARKDVQPGEKPAIEPKDASPLPRRQRTAPGEAGDGTVKRSSRRPVGVVANRRRSGDRPATEGQTQNDATPGNKAGDAPSEGALSPEPRPQDRGNRRAPAIPGRQSLPAEPMGPPQPAPEAPSAPASARCPAPMQPVPTTTAAATPALKHPNRAGTKAPGHAEAAVATPRAESPERAVTKPAAKVETVPEPKASALPRATTEQSRRRVNSGRSGRGNGRHHPRCCRLISSGRPSAAASTRSNTRSNPEAPPQ